MAGISDAPFVQRLAVPAVCLLISFLAYTSQLLFHAADNLDPGPPTRQQSVVFNTSLACLWWTYYRACSVAPGRYPKIGPGLEAEGSGEGDVDSLPPGTRWCTKCAAPKPPRAHHCRHCRRKSVV